MQGQRHSWRPIHVITAAAIGMMHPDSVPSELLAHSVPGVLAVATARGSHSVLAARVLSEGLRAPYLARWRSFLGDSRLLTDR